MNGFLHNTIADLYGPYFLLFYAASIVVLIVAAYRSIRAVDRTGDLELPEIPAKLDPYKIAYLRGGANEVTRVAIASLVQRGLLRMVKDETSMAKPEKIGRGRRPDPRELNNGEATILRWTGFPATPSQVFAPGGLAARVKKIYGPYEARLSEENMLAPRDEMKMLALPIWLFGLAAIIGLGGYKLVVALAKGHHNVNFLWIMMALGGIVFTGVCWSLPRVSRLGKAYLKRLELAYGGLKDRIDADGVWGVRGSEGEEIPGKTRAAPAGFDCLLLVGIFGISSLSDTPLSDLRGMFARGAWSDGAGCGGGGGGCGGCGGCGD